MAIINSIHIDRFRGFHDVEIPLGGDVVAITGQNGTQKTTLLGMLSQPFSLSNKDAAMYGARTLDGLAFGSQLRDKFKFSPKFDGPGAHAWTLRLNPSVCGRNDFSCVSIARHKGKSSEIRFWTADKSRKKGTGYLHVPVLFLSLKRLLPIGELPKVKVATTDLDDAEISFFKKYHDEILYSTTPIRDVAKLEGTGKSSLAPGTDYSDALTISAGQDNVGKIILSVLSFSRLKRQYPSQYKGGLLFIDEIETAMYPAAQIQLMKFMFKMASELKIQFFFTTHSETVLRFLKVSPYSRKANVVFLKKIDQSVHAQSDLPLPAIENNLFLNAFEGRIPSPTKIRVYAEDDLAFMFISSMLPKTCKAQVSMQKGISLSAGTYKLLTERKVPEFAGSVIVLDGDKNGTKDGIRESEKRHFRHMAFLPGRDCPEKMLYDFFNSLSEGDGFWDNENNTFNKQMCFSGAFSAPDNTDGYKKWFERQMTVGGDSMRGRMVKYWVKCHADEAKIFRAQFVAAYNAVAPRHGMVPMEMPEPSAKDVGPSRKEDG